MSGDRNPAVRLQLISIHVLTVAGAYVRQLENHIHTMILTNPMQTIAFQIYTTGLDLRLVIVNTIPGTIFCASWISFGTSRSKCISSEGSHWMNLGLTSSGTAERPTGIAEICPPCRQIPRTYWGRCPLAGNTPPFCDSLARILAW